jgi:DNA polymerase-3 subunit delta
LAVAGSADDPFRVADLEREAHGRVKVEVTALSMTGGRRAVRVREATDTLAAVVQAVLDGKGEALLILESGALPGRSKLRALMERHADAAVIACYREEARGLEQTIRAVLAAREVSIEDEAVEWLSGQLGLDRGVTRQEIEKLALFAGPKGLVSLADAMATAGDMAGLQIDDSLFAATAGDVEGADRALELAMAEGAAAVSVLRAALGHMQRLQQARAAVDDGAAAADAMKLVRPPIYYRRTPAFTAAVRTWNGASIAGACGFLAETERECKRTGAPADLLCRNAILSLARRARAGMRK